MVIATDSAGYSQLTWVNATATPFTIAANPVEQQLLPNSTAQYSITVNGIGNFNDTVRLSTSGSPVGASLSSGLLNFSGAPGSLSADLTVSVPAGTAAGSYVVQVTGTYLRPEYVCTCAPKVALNYTIPVFVTVLSTSVGGTQFLGIPIITFYETVGAIGAAVVVTGMYLVIRWRRTVSGLSSGSSKENKL